MYSLVTSLTHSKTEGRKDILVIVTWKDIDFWHLDQAVPIRLRNRIMCTQDRLSILSRNFKNELVSTDYTSKGGEKQFSYVQKGGKTKKSEDEVHS